MTGRSKPYSWRSCAWRAGSMPRSPASVSIGSPGMRRTSRKVSSVIPMKVGMMRLTRVAKKRSMSRHGVERHCAAPPTFSPTALGCQQLFYIDAVEFMLAERAQLEADDFLAHRLELYRMRDGEPWCLFLEDDLRLAIERVALLDVGLMLGLDDQVIEGLEAPFGDVAAAGFGGIATEQDVQEVVRVAVVAGPAQLRHLVLALLGALAVVTPFVADDLCLDPDLVEIGLHELTDTLGIGVVGAL